tara:strand:- start:710 stop:898 length:189 start_codon:yes stop_codon:yes gene_type:complete
MLTPRRTREEFDMFKTRLKVQSSKLKTPTNRNQQRRVSLPQAIPRYGNAVSVSLPRAFNFEL